MISFACGESVKPDIHLLLRHSLTSNPPHFCCPKLLASAAISKRYLIIPTLIFNSIRTPMADSTSRVVSQPECDGDAKSENVTPCFTEIIVIRHGETEWNADGRIQGHLDIELNDVGRQQAMAVAARLSKEPRISVIYSSDLKRAHETAEIIARRCGDLEVCCWLVVVNSRFGGVDWLCCCGFVFERGVIVVGRFNLNLDLQVLLKVLGVLGESSCNFSATMDNNALSAILAGIETLSRGMARMNAGFDRLNSNMASMKGDMSTTSEIGSYGESKELSCFYSRNFTSNNQSSKTTTKCHKPSFQLPSKPRPK
ncbi:putative phosphoglycerate mutase GpmB [Capsicum annuum]|nr:putative phosphoglycerate mutase GpmB [Capsicum annuum]